MDQFICLCVCVVVVVDVVVFVVVFIFVDFIREFSGSVVVGRELWILFVLLLLHITLAVNFTN